MASEATAVDLSKYIKVRIFGQRPRMLGRRIPVAIRSV